MTTFRRAAAAEETPAEEKIGPRQQKATEYVSKHGKITRREYERVTGVSAMTAKRDLVQLVNAGVLRRIGQSTATVYVLAEPED